MSPGITPRPARKGQEEKGLRQQTDVYRDGTLVFPPIWQQAIGLFSACLLLVLQIFVGRSAEKMASAISLKRRIALLRHSLCGSQSHYFTYAPGGAICPGRFT
jgi:hypothetical protein